MSSTHKKAEKAMGVIRAAHSARRKGAVPDFDLPYHEVVAALLKAGMLMSAEEHAVIARAREYVQARRPYYLNTISQGRNVMDAVAALIESEKAPPNWYVESSGVDENWLVDRRTGAQWLGHGFSRAVAQVACDQLNREQPPQP